MKEYDFSDIKKMTVDELINVLIDGTPSNKEDAANIIATLKSARAVNALKNMIDHETDYYAKEAGRKALAIIQNEEYIPEPKTAEHLRGGFEKDETRDDKVDPTEGKNNNLKQEKFVSDPRFHDDNLD